MIFQLQIANAAMFVPMAALARFSVQQASVLEISAACLLASVAIEVTQFLMAAGRTVDVDDVLFNTVGGILGATIAWGTLRVAEIGTR
ncbi:VanZ family protein [Streptomyces sp. MUM 203J]|nr:VanZ family protein [Streptomyces sp. MUM 203J]